jgi:hypothetical protein
MSPAGIEIVARLQALPTEEQLAVLQVAAEGLNLLYESQGAPSFKPEQMAELERRIALIDAGQSRNYSIEEAKTDLNQRRLSRIIPLA